jgi:hypothetical protein
MEKIRVFSAAGCRDRSMSTTSQHRLGRNWTTLWIVVAMLGVAAILMTLLPPASSDRGWTAPPTLVTSL